MSYFLILDTELKEMLSNREVPKTCSKEFCPKPPGKVKNVLNL